MKWISQQKFNGGDHQYKELEHLEATLHIALDELLQSFIKGLR